MTKPKPAVARVHHYPQHRESLKGTPCCLCGARPALRTQGKWGYCAAHVREAFEAARRAPKEQGQ